MGAWCSLPAEGKGIQNHKPMIPVNPWCNKTQQSARAIGALTFAIHLCYLFHQMQQHVDSVFHRLDLNRDGLISLDEFVSCCQQVMTVSADGVSAGNETISKKWDSRQLMRDAQQEMSVQMIVSANNMCQQMMRASSGNETIKQWLRR